MIILYTWNTPNGQKPAILLEELNLDYETVLIDITCGEQFNESFLQLNPNNKIPALKAGTDVIFESGAILQYLTEKYGDFLPEKGQSRASVLSWCNWQVGGLGPMIGQWAHFAGRADVNKITTKDAYAKKRYLDESIRLLDVLNNQLLSSEYVAGTKYSIADIMIFPWIVGGLSRMRAAMGKSLPEWQSIDKWVAKVETRNAVKRAMSRLAQEVENYNER